MTKRSAWLLVSILSSFSLGLVACGGGGSSGDGDGAGDGDGDTPGTGGSEGGDGDGGTGGTGDGDGDTSEPDGPEDCDLGYYCNHACLVPDQTVDSCTFLNVDLGLNSVDAAVIHEDLIYLALSNVISTMPIAGGSLTEVLAEGPPSLAVGEGYLFFTRYGGETSEILRLPIGGDTPESIYTTDTLPSALEVAGGRVYFISDGGGPIGQNEVRSMLLDGTDVVVHGDGGDYPVVEIAAVPGAVFWFQEANFEDQLVTAGADETSPTVIGPEQFGQLLTVYGDNLYWISENENLRTMPIAGGTPTTFRAGIDSGGENREMVGTSHGLVAKLRTEILIFPWDGGEPTEVAHVAPNMAAFVANDQYAYIFGYVGIGRYSLP